MAKKEENKQPEKETRKTPEKKEVKKPGAAEKTVNSEISGNVKGPMGVGGKKKPDNNTAKAKEPSKINHPTDKGDPKKAKKASTTKKKATAGRTKKSVTEKAASGEPDKLPKPKKALPKETTATKEEASRATEKSKKAPEDKSLSDKPAKFKKPLTDEEVPPKAAPATKETSSPEEEPSAEKKAAKKPAKTTAAKKKKASKAAKPTEEKEEEKKTPIKKMSRKAKVEGISAEEKMKMPNTSPTDDLAETAKSTAKDLADQVLPDEKTREDLTNIAKGLIPDPEKVRKTAEDIADKLTPDPEKAKELVDKLIPGKEEIKETAEKAKEATEPSGKKETEEQRPSSEKPVEATLLTDYDVHLFKEGKHYHLYNKLGSHVMEYMDTKGVYFALWAPNAERVSVIGDFNEWNRDSHLMTARWDHSGIWEIFIPDAKKGSLYKYFIKGNNGYEVEKGDPFAFMWETPPDTASVVWDLENTWTDNDWLEERRKKTGEPQAYSVYELHLGSWKRVPEDGFRSLSYRELADDLPGYLKEMGFTHVEFMPVMEHPFFGSWGYQITGYFAPSSRFGTPQDFMHLIESLHKAGIGVILDWVPSHFPSDMHGLHYFDGTFLYEHEDPQKGFHPDWQSYIFNYGRNEVRSFLISNALFWLDKFHADGLRVDAVASMLYLDYSRNEGEWQPNEYGGRENLEALSFLKEFNEVVYKEFPDAITIAEESTAWPMVSRPTYIGGLGFGQKWMMGWMHDTLEYFSKDPIHRRHHQNTITFSSNYAFSENFMLPLSHDEVVYGKQSLLNKMPGDEWNKFANLRSLYAYMFAHPGTKLLFMGAEFGQPSEWNHDGSLEWHLTNEKPHRQIQETLKELNRIYKSEPALYQYSFSSEGFNWVDINDEENSIISFLRKAKDRQDDILVVCNFTPVPRENYRIGVSEESRWKEIFNSDAEGFGGSNVRNTETIASEAVAAHHQIASLSLTIPPMGVIYLKKE